MIDILKKIEGDILQDREIHPTAELALQFLESLPYGKLKQIGSILKANSIRGIKQAQVCEYALNNFLDGLPLTDTHILGLAWTLLVILKEQKVAEMIQQNKEEKTNE
jgi:hypothetical protein